MKDTIQMKQRVENNVSMVIKDQIKNMLGSDSISKEDVEELDITVNASYDAFNKDLNIQTNINFNKN